MRNWLVALGIFLGWLGSVCGAEPMRAHFINMGQANSTLLEFSRGAILIDAGAQDDERIDTLVEYLDDFFRGRPDLNRTLDSIIITHNHIDHIRGLKAVVQNFTVKRYFDNGLLHAPLAANARWVRTQSEDRHILVRAITDGEITSLDHKHGLTDGDIDPINAEDCDPKIVILSGQQEDNPGWPEGDFQNENNHSLVIRVDFGESSMLFAGDLEEPAIRLMLDYYSGTDMLDVDLYEVNHHGSINATISEYLSALTPEIALFSCGSTDDPTPQHSGFNAFSFGHPRREVVQMLSDAIPGTRSSPRAVQVGLRGKIFTPFVVRKRMYATGWDSTVVVTARLDGTMRVTTERAPDEGVLLAAVAPPVSPAVAPAAAAAAANVEAAAAAPFQWNRAIPEKRPANGGNGKLILFDASHGGTGGASDWVIDGGFSDFADALVDSGYTVREYRGVDKDGDGVIRFLDDRRPELADRNEAIIDFAAIHGADVFIMAESNRPFRKSEQVALLQFAQAGKGLLFIADHYNADRNLNSWDATEVFNGYNRSTLPQFNLGGFYGDQRNPGIAQSGWLSENFGLRFRFNAIDCKSGVSDIAPPADSEQLTKDVEPILAAAGSTLAIVDPARAKGLVYLAGDDRVSSWSSAVEGEGEGLYFGGRNEGPLVAISKPNRGKAAFIGDSSPIEDSSPRYRNEENGGKKRLHNGWRDRGSASVLCLNLVNWLAVTEDYVGFQAAEGRTPGEATSIPLAPVEQDDPDDGRPWRQPKAGYDPWNPETFAAGSFGARFGAAGEPGGGAAGSVTLQVPAALETAEGTRIAVEGVIQAEINDQYGLKLGAELSSASFLAVQLPADLRERFNPHLNADARGKKVRIVGQRGKYLGLPGLRSVKSIEEVASP